LQDKKNPTSFRGFSYPTWLDIRERNSLFSGLMAHNLAMVGLGEKESTRRGFTDVVSANYFSVLGVTPIRGRTFRPEEETPVAACVLPNEFDGRFARGTHFRASSGYFTYLANQSR
jgi:hypothetical protein